MANLLKAELRKILSTHLWWALLIPAALLALVWAWIWAGLGSGIADTIADSQDLQLLGVSLDNLPVSVFALARAVNISTVFPMILGGLAMASEWQRKTITTTFLTAPSRLSVLSAKLTTYLGVGLSYGLVVTGFASAGIVLGSWSRQDLLPDAGDWLALVGTGLLETLLWTVLAVGVGALLGNAIATLLTLLLYSIVVENLVVLALPGHVPAFFPNQAADGITSAVAGDVFLDRVGHVPFEFQDEVHALVRAVAGARGTYAWWLEALIFSGWAVIFFGAGWLTTRRRDVK